MIKTITPSLEVQCENLILELGCRNPNCCATFEVSASELHEHIAGILEVPLSILCPYCHWPIRASWSKVEIPNKLRNYLMSRPVVCHDNEPDVRKAIQDSYNAHLNGELLDTSKQSD